jgi:hypothetical protein
MSSVQLHLALTHVPVILALLGFVMLTVNFFLKNETLTKTAYVILVAAGMAAIPVFLTGEGAEEAVENLPGVSENIIESHEDLAKLSMIAISIAGAAALAALLAFTSSFANRFLKVGVFVLSMIAGGLMAQTAHLGGQIRHTEIRNATTFQNTDGNNEQGSAEQEKDDD